MQEQKAENTGRQFCSCFYQLLGIGGSGPTMPGRILGGSCGNVRLFSVLPLLPLVRTDSVPFYPRSFSRDPSLALADGSSFPAWLSFFLRPPARRLVSLPFVLPTLSAPPPPYTPRFFSLLFIVRLPRVPRVIEVTLHGALGYVVCPIFTHGKSTLKRRWSLLSLSLHLCLLALSFSLSSPSSFLSPFSSSSRFASSYAAIPSSCPSSSSGSTSPSSSSASYSSSPIFFLHPLLKLLFNKRRSPKDRLTTIISNVSFRAR